ncbi:hypothetical protein ACWD4L_10585 [Streptomyces sp. NPDC002596]
MSEIAATTVHEAYAFACMGCGHGWEQVYDIEHHTDGRGQPFVVYRVQGQLVPSPLNRLTCLNCDGHKVRIMRAGQVSSIAETLRRLNFATPTGATAGPIPSSESSSERSPRQWHFVHMFRARQRRK